jgi:hypothetical protein
MAVPAHGTAAVSVADVLVQARDRDAWATINGFVYQVATTIRRWMDLPSDEILALEVGEDIDQLRGALPGEPPSTERLAEQVKLRAKNVTLRSAGAVDAICSALETLALNPGHRIRFRFTTNAESGKEQDSPLQRNGIEAWQRVHAQWDTPALSHIAGGVQALLQTAKRPARLADTTWTRFDTWRVAAQPDEIGAFMGLFEWSTGSGSVDDVESRVLVDLRVRFPDVDPREGYSYLFYTVFRLLGTQGSRQLTRASLDSAVRARPVGDAYLEFDRVVRPLVYQLRRDVQDLASRHATLESRVKQDVGALERRVGRLAGW